MKKANLLVKQGRKATDLRNNFDSWATKSNEPGGNMNTQSTQTSQDQNIKLPTVDLEWLQLLLDAKSIGLSVEDIRVFLRNNSDNDVMLDMSLSNNEHS